MGTGYVRQSAADIIAGNEIEAAPLNAEFNQLRDAFHESSGHSHDGTTGEGPKIDLSTSTTGILPVAQGGTGGINKVDATTAPTANDDSGDGYAVGSLWIDITNDRVYVAVDVTVAAAVWRYVGSTAISALAATTPAADKLPYYTSASAANTTDLTAFARTILDDADAATVRTTIGAQPLDTELTALAGLTSAADKGIQFTGAGTAGTYDLTAFAKTLLDDANQAAMQTTLGLVPGTNVQAYDADLAAIAALSGTNTIYYRSGANTWTAVVIGGNLTFSGGTLDAVASSLDATLTSIAALTPTTDQSIYFTASDTAATYSLTAFARTILDDADQAAVQATLGLTPGTNVQAYDADLASLAALSSNGMIARTGAGTAAVRTLTAPAAGITVSNGDGVSGNPTLALANDLAALEALSGTNTLYYRSGADTWSPVTIGSGVSFSGGTLSATSTGGVTLMTPVATTSGAGTTGKSFTIPSGAKKITISLNNVSLSSNFSLYMRIGDAGGIESTGYTNKGYSISGTTVGNQSEVTTYQPIIQTGADISSGAGVHGTIEMTLVNSSTNAWLFVVNVGVFASFATYHHFGAKTLSQELTTVTVYATAGNFDAGELGCIYVI